MRHRNGGRRWLAGCFTLPKQPPSAPPPRPPPAPLPPPRLPHPPSNMLKWLLKVDARSSAALDDSRSRFMTYLGMNSCPQGNKQAESARLTTLCPLAASPAWPHEARMTCCAGIREATSASRGQSSTAFRHDTPLPQARFGKVGTTVPYLSLIGSVDNRHSPSVWSQRPGLQSRVRFRPTRDCQC